ncbi:DEAD-domain-containing protein [Pholiota molesta]|nr:DEAD-domain-containing protein [Pholiota molesta]
MEVEVEASVSTLTTGNIATSSEHKKTSKKRTLTEAEPPSDDEAMIGEETLLIPPARSLSPELRGTLPSFPLPALPNAPSKSLLALQGLDQALISAELDDGGTRLSERMRKRLRDLGITELFAVQTALLPFLIPENEQSRGLYLPFNPPRDVCVSAPTTLSSRIVTRLRALIVLPTRDLVAQIGTATGQHSFAHEQSQLIQDQTSDLLGGSSKVDILICTPGRLIDHIWEHQFFSAAPSLSGSPSVSDWLAQVLAATRPHPKSSPERVYRHFKSHPLSTMVPDGIAPAFLHRLSAPTPSFFWSKNHSTVLDVVMEKFSMPSTLKEHMIVSASTQKPLVFFHLVHQFSVTNALVFTKSAESTTRLVRLFDFFEADRAKTLSLAPIVVRSYSSDLPVQERKSILEQFKNQRIHILVCSDLISRGIDISHVSHVVSYDVPVDMRKYVHRVGRTARAGRDGDAWTLVEEQEARYFKQMLKEADHLERVKRIRLSEKDLAPLVPHYEIALNQLKEVYTRQS